MRRGVVVLLVLAGCWAGMSSARAASNFSVGSYNVENYLDADSGTRKAKSPEAKAKVREIIRALNVDVLALQEMGGTNALLELRASLRNEGVDYPHWQHVRGVDTNVHLAVLSRFPFGAKRHHTNDNFLLGGRHFQVSRGFAEVDIQVNPRYDFTLLVAHLKSKRPIPDADQAELREAEAVQLRKHIDVLFGANPNARIILAGDLNDTKDSRAVKTIRGSRGNRALIDARPAECNGDPVEAFRKGHAPMNITWTYFYDKEDTYSRIDYLLLSRAMAPTLVEKETYVLAVTGWGIASDHRPVRATFLLPD